MANNALGIANKLANMFNGSKPKTKTAPVKPETDTFQKIGNNLANKSEAAKKFQSAFKKSLGGR